jgi:hypothetical protein
MIESKIIYFERPGQSNTDETLSLARERAEGLGIKYLVVASTSGATALRAAHIFQGTDVRIVGITLHAGRWQVYRPPDWGLVEQARGMGVTFHTATHALVANAERAIRDRFGGISPIELIAEALTIFSVGVKVAVEVSLMAADGNLIPIDQDVIAVAGTDGGADTALVLMPAYSSTLFNLRVKEIICKPRIG